MIYFFLSRQKSDAVLLSSFDGTTRNRSSASDFINAGIKDSISLSAFAIFFSLDAIM